MRARAALLLASSCAAADVRRALDRPAVTAAAVDAVNAAAAPTWRASVDTRFRGATVRDVQALCGATHRPGPALPRRVYGEKNSVPLPESFDWREEAGERCPSILEVRDQANCGNCWAVSSSQVLTDRLCLASNGTHGARRRSGQDITSCTEINGCEGADLVTAWEYIHTTGVVSGGPYGDTGSCYPYQLPHCTQTHGTVVKNRTYPFCKGNAETPACPMKCANGEDWAAGKVRAGAPYYLTGEEDMKQELVQHGPLAVTFSIYDDFPAYQGGVYQNTSANLIGGHAVGLYGYGAAPDGTKYWLLKNIWNVEWGEAGWFRILRGSDNSQIESGINARCRPAAAEVTH
eukprot:TRINITY_DN27756_c0_g1_i1.p1 TRINITY_DN27756_c0_g1~~TRINITY_DN27756_c0_g1_i1.p1  ORF type:complete len:347 (+),score=121.95 TRINITY_DN27756_c0_g1_i1:59-1099(+)